MVSEIRTRRRATNVLTDKQLIEEEEGSKEVPALDQEDTSDLSEDHLTYQWRWKDLVWRNVILLSLLHILSVYAWFEYMINPAIKWQTCVATFVFGLFSSSLGITAGAHRLWAHRSYKAKWPLRLLLAIANTMALQNDIYDWCRDHRVHHKFSETNADPHNSRRGFFFAHMGWLLVRKHDHVRDKGSKIDLSDLMRDPIVRYQRKYYIPLVLLIWGVIPTLVPYYLWGESLWFAFLGCVCFRYVYVLHCTWLVNSAAHLSGHRPYDQHIEPRENNSVVYLAFGEGYHNYHHTFPWDYSASEYGWRYNFNITTLLIDSFEAIGLAYDLKKPSKQTVQARMNRSGDGTDNRTERSSKGVDWFYGIIVTTSQLFVSLGIRQIVQFVKNSSWFA